MTRQSVVAKRQEQWRSKLMGMWPQDSRNIMEEHILSCVRAKRKCNINVAATITAFVYPLMEALMIEHEIPCTDPNNCNTCLLVIKSLGVNR